MTIAFPWHVDGRGRTGATTDPDTHVRHLVEQVLLTAPGERVMRPQFGAGLATMVFEPGGAAVAATAQFLVTSALEQTLADVITVQAVQVDAVDSALVVSVSYQVNGDQSPQQTTVRLPGGAP